MEETPLLTAIFVVVQVLFIAGIGVILMTVGSRYTRQSERSIVASEMGVPPEQVPLPPVKSGLLMPVGMIFVMWALIRFVIFLTIGQ